MSAVSDPSETLSVQRGAAAAPEAPPEATVVIVNYNGGDYLAKAVASLARQTVRNFETIVVDNASADGSLERIAEAPDGMVILRQPTNLGFAGGNNVGARAGTGKWLVLLNPDAEAEADWLERLLEAVRLRPGYRMAASLQISMHEPDKLDGAGDNYLAYGYAWRGGFGHALGSVPAEGECFAPCGAAALYPRDLFLAVGGFDERYFCYHEDVDIGFRLRLLGERCQFVPSARVKHAGSAISGRASPFSVFHGVRNGVWTYVKNMPAGLLALTFPVWVAGALALLARGVVVGQFASTLKGFVAGIGGLGPMLATRRELQAQRRTDADVAGAMVWNPLAYPGRSIQVQPFELAANRSGDA